MVVAEVPLWVIHTSATGGANGMFLGNETKKNINQGNDDTNNGSDKDNANTFTRSEQLERAKASLSMLDGQSKKKCAIYSIDIHPNGTKFATGGGDGTVRLWNASALFQKPNRTRPRYTQSGEYDSSSGTDENISLSSSDDDENNNNEDNVSKDDNHESNVGNHGHEKRKESKMDVDTEDQKTSEFVHDLSDLVRRKKDGSTISTSKAASSTAAATTTTTSATTSSPSTNKSTNSKNPYSSHHRLLCTLSAHTGSSVLAVRFSRNGRYLASAGDDAVVCIYARAGSHATLQDSSSPFIEHWTRIKLCRGHTLDAVGLAWAPDDSHLVSCSLDSNAPIIVWKVTDLVASQHRPTHSNVLCNPYKILGKGIHTSTVKGVTFDPAGTYLASSGDDPSVCIWRAHDDWGLENRIDASAGIFRRWKESDAQALSSQTLFRRLSWSTDGSYICSTNSVVKNKNVASTISREGWSVSGSKSTATGAANLVGHKQPVVVSRHCPFLLDASSSSSSSKNSDLQRLNGNEEPDYATLLALGDKRGFVTVWSTRRSRPIFKVQCSESRNTVTDLSWGKVDNNDLTLIVSLLDGQVVALRFNVPGEVGNILSHADQARVFQLRYGMDMNDGGGDFGRNRLFVGENAGPKLIENALQYSLEDMEEQNEEISGSNDAAATSGARNSLPPTFDKSKQGEYTTKGGKKRVRPMLLSPVADEPDYKHNKASSENGFANGGNTKAVKKTSDPLQNALDVAQKAASGVEALTNSGDKKDGDDPAVNNEEQAMGSPSTSHHQSNNINNRQPTLPSIMQVSAPQIPFSTDRVHSVELPIVNKIGATLEAAAATTTTTTATTKTTETTETEATSSARAREDSISSSKMVADCVNHFQIPAGSSGNAVPCSTVSISRDGRGLWRDQLPGVTCSAIAASKQFLAIGFVDGSIQLYGTSPTLGWASGVAFRSFPPIVLGSSIVTLNLHDRSDPIDDGKSHVDMLLVTADASFIVYGIFPEFIIRYKGTILPPMRHMLLSADLSKDDQLPRLARIQITESNQLFLLLSLETIARSNTNENRFGSNGQTPVGVGGSLQAFVYFCPSETWMRVADSRFALSDFYSTLPTLPNAKAHGELSKYDDLTRMGSVASSLRPSRRGRLYNVNPGTSNTGADSLYNQTRDDSSNDMATRAHCEDRMACAVALGCASEFKYWLSLYVRTLTMAGQESMLRLLADMILGKIDDNDNNKKTKMSTQMEHHNHRGVGTTCWWLSSASNVLSLDRSELIRSALIPEMSKNRALQRLTNELAMEVDVGLDR